MTRQAELIMELKGDRRIETVCDECGLSRQTFNVLRRHGRVKLSTLERLLKYLKPTPQQRLEIIREWVLSQLGKQLAREFQISINPLAK